LRTIVLFFSGILITFWIITTHISYSRMYILYAPTFHLSVFGTEFTINCPKFWSDEDVLQMCYGWRWHGNVERSVRDSVWLVSVTFVLNDVDTYWLFILYVYVTITVQVLFRVSVKSWETTYARKITLNPIQNVCIIFIIGYSLYNIFMNELLTIIMTCYFVGQKPDFTHLWDIEYNKWT